ncbi:MAG: hypothetical protein F4Y00_06300 [Bacteroidetes bacterium SB0662_bin_6]|nr:hypothetical protein [Bacteroidetes bacterium SB0662_bin_6]
METPDMTVSRMENKQSASRPREAPGLLRELLSVEWKLFRRNRRPRWGLIFSSVVLLIGSGSVLSDPFDSNFLAIYLMIVAVSHFFVLNCRSTFYDGLLSRPVSETRIAKIIVYTHHLSASLYFGILMVLSGVIQRNPNDIFMITSAFLYVLGICNYLLAFAATCLEPPVRIELNMKFSDVGHGEPYREIPISKDAIGNRWIIPVFWLLTILSMGLVFSVYFFSRIHGIAFPAMAVLGLAGLLFHAGWVRLIARTLKKRRYELLERFRGG